MLYYFTCARCALDNISKRYIKISKRDDLNDPFEQRLATEAGSQYKDVVDEISNDLSKKFGIVCFTHAQPNHPLMWAHYADKHAGICLGFEHLEDPDSVARVDYGYDRPIVPENMLQALQMGWASEDYSAEYAQDPDVQNWIQQGKLAQENFQLLYRKMITSKHKDWEYEKESRLLASLDDNKIEKNGMQFLSWDNELVLRTVVLGANCDCSEQNVYDVIGDDQGISVVRATLDRSTYAVIIPGRV